ncbi:hypothetical protein LSUB1_G000481 [Lachnellula subtilissima]|uniref:Uncharacterized protein n=1 Tax=Lachnellula subtilissima TaxID=602034 RepID=A0A8H8S190_9HELO|nr:hypothetical protein LSUB1_G000481 [Lachnellula subtilissima]
MSGTKRKHSGDSPSEVYNFKSSRSRPSVEARVDPTYGQRSALPGLDDASRINGDNDELDYSEDMDALGYLRAVRKEAIGIPNLLVAPKEEMNDRAIYENGVGDYRGSYGDGAYYAADSNSEVSEEQAANDRNIAYFDSIMTKFEALRDRLQNSTPPSSAVEKLDADHPTHVGPLNTAVARWWRWKMRQVDPLPAQIASMDKGTILRLLGLLTGGTLLQRGSEVNVGVSRWAWSLLARLPERGELTSEEIGIVRELGKKAVLVGMGLKEDADLDEGLNAVDPQANDDVDDGEVLDSAEDQEVDLDVGKDLDRLCGEGATSPSIPVLPNAIDGDTYSVDDSSAPQSLVASTQTVNLEASLDTPSLEKTSQAEEASEFSEELAAAKARLLGNLKTAEESSTEKSEGASAGKSKWNTRATVDMIITVAGEAYGQRDLLEFRRAWDQIM